MRNRIHNPFDKYSSKIPRIYIPLPNYKFYHKASDERRVDSKFIGRKHLSKKLRNWLQEGNSGSYLITGYRGMGKSSFVGKVLNDICYAPGIYWNCFFVISVLGGFVGCFLWLEGIESWLKPVAFGLCGVFCALNAVLNIMKRKKYGRKFLKRNLLITKISLGHEILNERDILCLIGKNIHQIYNGYLRNPQLHLTFSYLHCFLAFIVSWGMLWLLIFLFRAFESEFTVLTNFNDSISRIEKALPPENYLVPYVKIIMFIGLLAFSFYFIRRIIYYINGVGRKLSDLERLIDRIDASVNEDKGPAGVISTSILGVNINRKRNKVFPRASIREIESELLTILNGIDRPFLLKPRFIIVFDELDKIDPETNYATSPSENLPEFRNNTSGFPEGATSRKRKQNVLNLLANMKLFVSSSNTKFIFISGRELYDAFLADLSDREFAISSIFNGVLYVDSFLSSDKNIRDVSSMTETYICKQLIPRSFLRKKRKKNRKTGEMAPENNLKLYYDYLKERTKLKNDEMQHIIILLYHFSVYLSHISNGSPKKISLYFEQYIKSKEEIGKEEIGQTIIYCPGKYRYYLSFGYTDQRKIGFVHYIAFPALQSIINRASQYGDKLLVSASFLIDHIYKYHNHGFSWRNLEYTPELLEVYRTPELRKFIESIVSSLKQTHLSPISCGLYQLKFRKKISEEISMFSKFSEEISAIFNFTLDESLSVKKHYYALLRDYEKSRDHDYSLQSLASVHHILGDLHMSDEEYNEAIFEYQKSLHILSGSKSPSKYQMANTLSLIRTILKLGLTYELRHTYNSAYVIYSELVNQLVDYRYLDEKELQIQYVQLQNKDQWYNKDVVLYCSQKQACKEKSDTEISSLSKQNNSCHWSPRLVQRLDEIEDLGYYTKGENMLTDMAFQINPEVGSILLKLSLFEDIRLIYQALLAKLFVLEKIELGGITQDDLKVVEAEYTYLHLSTNEKEKFIISADFFRKLAEIMYYKNGLPYQDNKFFRSLYFWGYDVNIDILDYCRKKKNFYLREKINELIDQFEFAEKDYWNEDEEVIKEKLKIKLFGACGTEENELNEFVETELGIIEKISIKKVCECMTRRKRMFDKNIYLPCYACKYYNRSLKILAHYLFGGNDKIDENSKAIFFCRQIRNLQLNRETGILSLRSNYLSILGYSLDGMGNVMFSCADKIDKLTINFLDTFFEILEKKGDFDIHEVTGLSQTEKAILYYWDASEAFKLASNLQESSSCMKKILSIFLNYLIVREDKDNENDSQNNASAFIQKYLRVIKKTIVQRALQNLYSHYEYINITEIQMIKWIFSKQMYENIPLQYLSLFPDIEEILLIYYEIRLRCEKSIQTYDLENKLSAFYQSGSLVKLRNESTVCARIYALKFKAYFNYEIFKEIVRSTSKEQGEELTCVDLIDSPYNFYAFLIHYLNNNSELSRVLGKDYEDIVKNIRKNATKEIRKCEEKYLFLEFLVNDSLFCLTKIIEIIEPSNMSTLFSNSFMAEVYQSLLRWNILYEDIYLLLRAYDLKQRNLSYTVESSRIQIRIEKIKEPSGEGDLKQQFELLFKIIKRWDYSKKNYSEEFFQNILKNIDKSNIHYTMNNYLAEMALKKLKEAKEMHSEGRAYKDMIDNIYLLDDDLNNDTCQFNFAVERYLINCGYIDERIGKLKEKYTNSATYDIEKYTQSVHENKECAS